MELNLSPPLVVEEDGTSRSLVVALSPALWFVQADGSLMDLSQFDYTATSQLIDFDLEIERGFDLEIET